MRRELTRLRRAAPSGGTPFYRTIQLGIEKLKEEAGDDDRTDPTVNVLLILTDGGDNPSERDRDPVLAKTINELLRQTNDVEVVTTAAYDTSCRHLADVGVPELQNPSPHTCHNVRVDVDIDETLQDIVGELVDARKR